MWMGINHWEWEGMGLKRYSRSSLVHIHCNTILTGESRRLYWNASACRRLEVYIQKLSLLMMGIWVRSRVQRQPKARGTGAKANSAFHPSGVGKWVPTSAGKAKAGMVHSVSGWTRRVQVKLWDPLRTRAIPERLRGVFTTRRYTNTRLPLPLPYLISRRGTFPSTFEWGKEWHAQGWSNYKCLSVKYLLIWLALSELRFLVNIVFCY